MPSLNPQGQAHEQPRPKRLEVWVEAQRDLRKENAAYAAARRLKAAVEAGDAVRASSQLNLEGKR